LIIMVLLWLRTGRDPKTERSIAVEYEPPEVAGKPLTPAQIGALVDETLDPRDLTASIIGLANKGYIELRGLDSGGDYPYVAGDDFDLAKLKEPDDRLTDFERSLMVEVFPAEKMERKVSALKNKFYERLPALRDALWGELVKRGFFTANPVTIRRRYRLIGTWVLILGVVILFFGTPYAEWKAFAAGGLSGVVILAFANTMPARTRKGAEARLRVLGFREFMDRADKDRIKRMGQAVFYEYLPYAIALDVVDHWADLFEDMVTEMPSWYVTARQRPVINVRHFSRSITVASSHLGATMFSAPRGSGLTAGGGAGGRAGGGGGGGFSGGGGGGGGGGSW
jgi:hypothetical protein